MLNLNSVMIGTKQPQVLATLCHRWRLDRNPGGSGWQLLSINDAGGLGHVRPSVPALGGEAPAADERGSMDAHGHLEPRSPC